MPPMKIFPISRELLDKACFAVERKYQRLPFSLRGITIDRNLIQATLEILNAEPHHTLPQNCRNDIRDRTPDGLDRRIKDYLATDLRTANIVTDVLESSGIVQNVQVPSPSTGRDIKGTQLLNAWVWTSDKADHPQSVVHKPERGDRLHEEIALYQRKLLENPYDIGTLRTLATAFQNSGNFEKSLEIFDRILKIESQDVLSSVNRGIVLLKMGRYLDAVSSIERGRSLGYKNDVAFYYLGLAHLNLGHFPEAERYFTEALKVNPHCKKAQEKLQTLEKSVYASHKKGEISGLSKSQDFNRSAFYCSDLLMVKLNAGDIASSIKYASDLVTFSDGEIRDAAKELVDQLEARMESGLDEIPVELITKADRIAHKVKLGFGTM